MKKIKLFVLLILSFALIACDDNKENKKGEESMLKQDLTIIEKNEDGEITKGTLEGYTFTETEEVTEKVKLQMEDGSVLLIVLSNNQTPITKANFQKLVSEKFYDGIIFHRVIEDFMIQGGDPTGTGYNGSDETIKGEFANNNVTNDMKHERGVISMARNSYDRNSASSQFFIMHKTNSSLDGDYAAFGRVFAGMDLVDYIASQDTDSNDKPLTEQKIKSIRFITIEK